MVTMTVPLPPGALTRLSWSRVIQPVSSFGVRPSAKMNALFSIVAAAAYSSTVRDAAEALLTCTRRRMVWPGLRWSTM